MMKEKWRLKGIVLILGLMLTFILTGCDFGMDDVRASVVMPESSGVSIEGQYVYKEVINLEEGKFVDETNFRNFSAEFTLGSARIGLEKVEIPKYISKLVNTFDYFLEKYRVNPTRLLISSGHMEVISISTSDRSFYEVFKLYDDNIAVIKGNNLIKLERASLKGQVPEEDMEADEAGLFGASEEALVNETLVEPIAGVLIGLRGERDELSHESTYRTLWITNDGEIQEVYEIDDILFPRKEFWKLQVVSDEVEGEVKERLNIYAITGTPSNVVETLDYNFPAAYVDVEFVGNNYVSIYMADDHEEMHEEMKKGITVTVDNYNNYAPVNILAVDPEEGETAFMNSLDQFLQKDEALEGVSVEKEAFLRNFTLRRHHGYWMMESRYLHDVDGEETLYKVPIALKPTKSLVAYDDLTVSWAKIKERVPQAIDAFNAPGNSFLLVRTPKYLMMYSIAGIDDIGEEPLQSVEIKEEEDIIMAEWARGEFVKRWTDVASKEGRKIIFVQKK